MRALCVAAAVGLGVALAGCAPPPKPIAERLPAVTLTMRDQKDDEITLRFSFTHMERVSWKNKVLRAQILKWGGKPAPGGPTFKNPTPEFSVAIGVAKAPGSEQILFVPMWGASDVPAEPIGLPAPDGDNNSISLKGYGAHRISQVLATCTGPDRPIPFDPEKGISLVTVGYAPDSYSVRIWADRPPRK